MADYIENNTCLKKKTLKNGQQLVIRTVTENDAEDLIVMMKQLDQETKFLAREPEEFSLTVEQEITFIRNTNENANSQMIVADVDGIIVGSCSVGRISNSLRMRHRASMGIAILQSSWGLGIGREMMLTCMEWCKNNGIEQLELDVVSENSRAISMYESLGFKAQGIKKNAMKYGNGEYADEYFMILDLKER